MSIRRIIRMRGFGDGSPAQFNYLMDLAVEKTLREAAPAFLDEAPPVVNMAVFEPLMRMILSQRRPVIQVTPKWPWNLAEDLALNSAVVRLKSKLG